MKKNEEIQVPTPTKISNRMDKETGKDKDKEEYSDAPEILTHPYYHKNMRPERLKEYTIWQSGGRIKRFIRRRKYDLNPDKSILINMELNTGEHISFIAKENDGGFKYKKKKYLFDYESSYYNLSSKIYCYDFHQNFSLPIKRQIPVNELQNRIEEDVGNEQDQGYAQVRYLTNPKTLYDYSIAKLAEGILKGAALEAWLKRIFFMVLLIIIFAIIIMVMIYVRTKGIPAPIPKAG